MGQIRVGTASWTDRTLIASGWYPPEADTPEHDLAVARDAETTHVLFNNCYRDNAQANAEHLAALLETGQPATGG